MNKEPRSIDRLQIAEAGRFGRAGVTLLEKAVALLRAEGTLFLPLGNNGLSRLMNLLYWRAEAKREYVDGESVYADQVVHFALHQLVATRVSANHPRVDLFAECLASAADVYLMGKLIQAGIESEFMQETLTSFGAYYEMYAQDERHFQRLLEQTGETPFTSMLELIDYLERFCLVLLKPGEADAAQAELLPMTAHFFYPLVHHYHVANWVLTLRDRRSDGLEAPTGLGELRARIFAGESSFLEEFGKP